MFFKTVKLAAVMALGLGVTSASAATFVYDLFDHPDGNKNGDYSYGLRIDEATPDRVFSFENGASATLVYDDVLNKVRIAGTMIESFADGTFGDIFEVKYTIENVTNIGMGLFKDTSGTGVGNITDGGADTLQMGAQADGKGRYFVFDDDDHRLGGYGFPPNTIVGRGWVNFADPDSTNDFLFTAELNPGAGGSVPLPAAAWMLLSGVAGLGVVARRRRKS